MICLNQNASFPQVHIPEKLLWLKPELCRQTCQDIWHVFGAFGSQQNVCRELIPTHHPSLSKVRVFIATALEWGYETDLLPVVQASVRLAFETGLLEKQGQPRLITLSRHKRQASVSQTNIPLTSAYVCVSLTCSQCSNLHWHVGRQGGFFGSVRDSGEKHLRKGHLHNSAVKSRLDYQASAMSWYAEGAPWLLCPKNQPRSWYWGNDSSWPESKVPATYKYNPPKWKGLSLVFSWTQACYPKLSLGFGETESPYTGQLRRAPPPRCPASHLAPAAKVRAARADWRLPGAAPLPLAARASLFQVPAAAESGCGSSRARCV